MGNMIFKDKKYKFIEMFNNETGFYLRTGILDDDGNDTGVDPFMRSFPQLLDVGIMNKCNSADKCLKAGIQCYQGKNDLKKQNMSIENFRKLTEQCKDKCFQFALGGHGNPNKHEHFKEILQICKDNNIVPNYTTSGVDLTDEEVKLTKEYCGAVAVSFHNADYTFSAIQKFIDAGIKTNIHYVLGNNSIDRAIDYLKNNKFPKGINAIVFLLAKPVGLGLDNNTLKYEDPRVTEFYEYIDNNLKNFDFKIGFDSCNVPGILNHSKNINRDTIDTCEAGRYSAYVTPDFKLLPCSFDNQDLKWAVDLNTNTIEEAWNSEQFNNFREHFKQSCGKCSERHLCLGGCPIKRNIVLCNRNEKDLKVI